MISDLLYIENGLCVMLYQFLRMRDILKHYPDLRLQIEDLLSTAHSIVSTAELKTYTYNTKLNLTYEDED